MVVGLGFFVEQLGSSFKCLLKVLDKDNSFLKRQRQSHLCIMITDLGFAVVKMHFIHRIAISACVPNHVSSISMCFVK